VLPAIGSGGAVDPAFSDPLGKPTTNFASAGNFVPGHLPDEYRFLRASGCHASMLAEVKYRRSVDDRLIGERVEQALNVAAIVRRVFLGHKHGDHLLGRVDGE